MLDNTAFQIVGCKRQPNFFLYHARGEVLAEANREEVLSLRQTLHGSDSP